MLNAPNSFLAAVLLILSLMNGGICQDNVKQPDYSNLTDAELSAKVIECKNRSQLESLITNIPLAILAKHASAAMEQPNSEPGFGRVVIQVLWPELWDGDQSSETFNRLFKFYRWSDDSGDYQVEAQLYDVVGDNAVLKKTDESIITVPLERLSQGSRLRLARYIKARQLLSERIPADTAQIVNLLTKQNDPRSSGGSKAREYLYSGRLKEGETALIESLAVNHDLNERFGLGVIQFMLSLETLVQDLNRHGFLTKRTFGEIMPEDLRKTFPDNPAPEEFSNEAFRAMIKNWIAGLERAEKTLSQVGNGKVKFRLEPSKIKLDPAGRGKPVSARQLLRLLFGGPAGIDPSFDAGVERFVELELALDRGDVHWLRGYLHLQMALGESVLAVDWNPVIEIAGHRLFERVNTPHQWLLEEPRKIGSWGDAGPGDFQPIITAIVTAAVDAVAAFSEMLHLAVIEPARFQTASQHVMKSIEQSRIMWEEILAERDDDQEWIPNPKQSGAIGVNVNDRMIKTWLKTLDEIELVLKGERVLPFWRFAIMGNWKDAPGVNLKKIIDNPPQKLSLILWIQGTAATPYLEQGKFTEFSQAEFAQQIDQVFGLNYFGGYALWFN